MSNRHLGDILGGLLMIAFGIFALVYAQRYSFGTVRQMGPGFFPVVLGGVLMVLGVLIVLPALRRPGPALTFNLRTLVLILGAVVVFGALLRPLGLPLATMAAVLLASMAERNFPWIGRLALALCVALGVVVIFRLGLGMNVPLWPRGM
ncbi:MAG: tripartite tricarboxylate transporter TctB family protein [Pararhodobacter sp.]